MTQYLIEKYTKLDQAECMVEAGEVLKDLKSLQATDTKEVCKHKNGILCGLAETDNKEVEKLAQKLEREFMADTKEDTMYYAIDEGTTGGDKTCVVLYTRDGKGVITIQAIKQFEPATDSKEVKEVEIRRRINENGDTVNPVPECPNCGKYMYCHEDSIYCPGCGLKIKWVV